VSEKAIKCFKNYFVKIKCPVSDCPGKLEMRDRVRELDKNIWKCTSMRGESSKKKPIRCTYE
jgi:hypothetical protein